MKKNPQIRCLRRVFGRPCHAYVVGITFTVSRLDVAWRGVAREGVGVRWVGLSEGDTVRWVGLSEGDGVRWVGLRGGDIFRDRPRTVHHVHP